MNLYKLTQGANYNFGYDTYDSCIVCAKNDEEARKIVPGFYGSWPEGDDLDLIEIELIGKARDNIKPGIVLASFNAG